MTNPKRPESGVGVADRTITGGAAVALVVLGLLPLSGWISGGLSDPAYSTRWLEWSYGIAVCVGVGVVCAMMSRSLTPGTTSNWKRMLQRVNGTFELHPGRVDVGIAAACLSLYAVIAFFVFSAKPLLIDELVQVLQARMYAAGHLSMPADPSPEFFSILHMVDSGDRVYSQFPPGWPAMLALGTLMDATWLVGPFCGGVAVFVFARLLRRTLPTASGTVVTAATALFGLAPFSAFQFSSHMSHGPAVMWLILAVLALSHVTAVETVPESTRGWWAALMGTAAGCAFAVRPLDAFAFGAPAGVWLAWRALPGRSSARMLAAASAGLAIPVCAVMWVNLRTTGSPFLFGYEVLWGSSHGLGFHSAPWGDPHTVQRGVELLSTYVTRLNVYLFESPFPSLLPVIVALLLAGRLSQIERYLFTATAMHALLYFAYWHDGFFLGPRFVMPWLPLLVVLCARLLRRSTWHAWSVRVRAGVIGGVAAAVVVTALISLPVRTAQYRAGLTSMRADYSTEARRAGVTNALVFVRESWGAELISRLWALGVSRAATAALYSRVDACVLEHAITAAEQESLRHDQAEGVLRPLLRDSLLVRASSVSPDTTERMLPGARYDATCSARVEADREGYALYPPLVLERETGNVYVRDFQARDTVILQRYPNRAAFVLRRDGVDGLSPLRWIPIGSGRIDPSAQSPRTIP